MTSYHLPDGHDWVRREVEVEGKTFFHRQCRTCKRDFVMAAENGYWRAAHLGLFAFDFLNEETNRQWTSHECPGRQIPEEINDLRMPKIPLACK